MESDTGRGEATSTFRRVGMETQEVIEPRVNEKQESETLLKDQKTRDRGNRSPPTLSKA